MNSRRIKYSCYLTASFFPILMLFTLLPDTFAQSNDQQANTLPVSEPQSEETPSQNRDLVKPEANLTPEQLANWKPSYQPVELLGVRKQTSFVTCVAAIPSDSRFLLAGRHVTLWSVQKTQPDHVFEWKWIPNAYMVAMAVAPDGKWFVTADCLGKVYRFDLTTRKLSVVKDIHMFDITDLAISPNGKDIAVLQRENGKWVVSIFDSRWITFKSKFISNPNSKDFSMAPLQPEVSNRLEYMDNERLLVMGARFSVLNTSHGTLETKLVKDKYIFTCGSLNDGKRFFTAYDRSLDICDKETLDIDKSYPQMYQPSHLVAFSPDDRYFASLNSSQLVIMETQTQVSLQRFRVDIERENQSIGMLWLATENLLIVAEQHGAIRIWGTKAEGVRLGLKPVHDSLNPDVSKRIPATAIEAQTVLDFGKMPIPQNSTNVSSTVDKFYCRAPFDLESSKLFYRYHLREMGWTEDVSDTKESDANSILFRKGAFKVRATFNEIGDGLTQIKFTYASNFDVRLAPRLEGDDIQLEQESEDSVVYHTSADLLKTECGLFRSLKKDGWILFEPVTGRYPEPFSEFLKVTAPERKLTFIKNGIILAVAISKPKGEPRISTIEYARWIPEYSVPVPPEINYLEFNDHSIGFTVLAFMKSSDLKAFYDKELQRQGWIAMPESPTPFPDKFCTNYIYQQQDLQLTFRQHSGGLSSVHAYCGNNTWQMTRLIYKDAPSVPWAKSVTEYCSFTSWLNIQKYEPGYDSIDRYEKEMRAILDKQRK